MASLRRHCGVIEASLGTRKWPFSCLSGTYSDDHVERGGWGGANLAAETLKPALCAPGIMTASQGR